MKLYRALRTSPDTTLIGIFDTYEKAFYACIPIIVDANTLDGELSMEDYNRDLNELIETKAIEDFIYIHEFELNKIYVSHFYGG